MVGMKSFTKSSWTDETDVVIFLQYVLGVLIPMIFNALKDAFNHVADLVVAVITSLKTTTAMFTLSSVAWIVPRSRMPL
jgi:hypothetical protein